MAGILRSPQFSEESAWLPPWLQPRHRPHADEQPQSQQSHQGDTSWMGTSQLGTACGSKNSSFRLFLSEESNLSRGSTRSFDNVGEFDLHLSSEGISQIPSNLPCDCKEVRMSAPVEAIATKSPSVIPVVPVDACEGKLEDNTYNGNSLARQCSLAPCISKEEHAGAISNLKDLNANVGFCQRKFKGSSKSIDRPSSDIFKAKKRKGKSSQGPQLNDIDIDEVVELCIAASEAVVISELASSNSYCELSSAKSIVSIALQVKQAREHCHMEVQASTIDQVQQIDEFDHLSDLDENDMSIAFDDVGMVVDQVVINSTNVGGTYSPRSFSKEGPSSEHMNIDLPGMTSQENAHFDKLNFIIRNSPAEGKDCEDGSGGIHQETFTRGIGDMFVSVSSTLSETVYTVGESNSVQLKTAPGIVPCSTKITEDDCGPSSHLNKITSTEAVFSQDFAGSSSFSSFDPLCSVVPCSLPLDNSIVCERETLEKDKEDAEPVSPCTHLPNFHGENAITIVNNVVPFSSSTKLQEASISKFQVEITGVTFRWSDSLRSYSMVVPKGGMDLSAGIGSLEKKSLDILFNMKSASNALQHNQYSCDALEEGTRFASLEPGEEFHGSQPTEGQIPQFSHSKHILTAAKSNFFRDVELCNKSSASHNESKHCETLCRTNITGQIGTSLKLISTSKKKRGRMENPGVAPRRDGRAIKSCLSYRSKSRSITLKELHAASKRVRFSLPQPARNQALRLSDSHEQQNCLNSRMRKKKKVYCQPSILRKESNSPVNITVTSGSGPIFYGLEFLVTGLTRQKRVEVENVIRMYGGVVLPSIPRVSFLGLKKQFQFTNQHCKLVISPRMVQTIEFLYGCAINTWILNVHWIFDSLNAGLLLPPGKYLVLPNLDLYANNLKNGWLYPCLSQDNYIFDKLGVMLHGRASFCSKFSTIIKHGGGQVFRSLQSLSQSLNGRTSIGAVIVESDKAVSRHLKHCALEHNLQTVSVNWIIDSLFSGKLLPLKRDRLSPFHRIKMPTFHNTREIDMSEEI